MMCENVLSCTNIYIITNKIYKLEHVQLDSKCVIYE